jgi:predicted Na+-dependent transporter
MDDVGLLLFFVVILGGIIYAGALAVERPKLWWLGGILFVLGFVITISAAKSNDQSGQIGGAILGLPFVLGFVARKFFSQSSKFVKFLASVASSLSVGALLSIFGLSAGTVSLNSLAVGFAVMIVSSIWSV